MARTIKRTRIKFYPPKVQLQRNDSISGSFPTQVRIPSDNRTGKYPVFFDDTNTVIFQAYNKIAYPSGLNSGSAALLRPDISGNLVLNRELTTNISNSAGVLRKGVGDSWVTFENPSGQSIKPFRDDSHPAVDAISTTTGVSQNLFYATGSKITDIGEGFDQPLWSKTKIEIDLTPALSHSFFIQNYTSASNNFPMAYWNNDLKRWQGVGLGKEFASYYAADLPALIKLLDEQPIGFTAGLDNGGTSVRDFSAGAVTSDFGFPYHPKFHATSSNTINISDYISEPFLVEKIVLDFSASLSFNSTSIANISKASTTTFFLMNQRSPFGFSSDNLQVIPYEVTNAGVAKFFATGTSVPTVYNGNYVNTTRDLIGYWQVVKFLNESSDSITRLSRDLNIINGNGLNTWGGSFRLSGSAKNPLSSTAHLEMFLDKFTQFVLKNQNSTRSGLPFPGGRDYLGTLEKGEVLESVVLDFANVPIVTLNRYNKINPYLLQPGDKLVFGWQLPYYFIFNDNGFAPVYPGKGPELSFPASPAKITIYGSLIREGKEYHDTLNQLLTSPGVHEDVVG